MASHFNPVTHDHHGDTLTFVYHDGMVKVYQPGGRQITTFTVDADAVNTQQQLEEEVAWWMYKNGAL